jgi:hypothetical protein
VKNQIESIDGYKLLSNQYIRSKNKLKIQCPKNHIFEKTHSDFKQGQRCPICSRRGSNTEKEILEYIKKIYSGKVLSNYRDILVNPITKKKLELDIYLPDLNKAIEYNGIYWHSSDIVTERDKIRKNQCKEKSIDLLTLLDKEWLKNKNWAVINDFITTQ